MLTCGRFLPIMMFDFSESKIVIMRRFYTYSLNKSLILSLQKVRSPKSGSYNQLYYNKVLSESSAGKVLHSPLKVDLGEYSGVVLLFS